MPHVITRACCVDAACTYVCPVDCIHPTPGEPGFGRSEMLYIDPAVCIDCGMCVQECPVGAIFPAERLPEGLKPFEALNAARFEPGAPLAPFAQRSLPAPAARRAQPLRVAIVGSGPAGCYAALELLERGGPDLEVEFIERLPTPWGLARAGVAPDHLDTKAIAEMFARRTRDSRLRFRLNVEVGRDVGVDELARLYHAVVFAVGASNARRLDIPGEDLPGSHSATEFVGWYNGHPDHASRQFDLRGPTAIVVGNGNVALDAARLLSIGAAALHASDMAAHALAPLEASGVRDIVVVGRRSAAHAACTLPELMALDELPDVEIHVPPEDLALTADERRWVEADPMRRMKFAWFERHAAASASTARRRITFRFLLSPVAFAGAGRIERVEFMRNRMADGDPGRAAAQATGQRLTLEAGMALASVGYRGVALPGLPFDAERGIVPNLGGRVTTQDGQLIAGAYAVGWIKRGPSGVLGSNRACAQETIAALLEDADRGAYAAPVPPADALDRLLDQRRAPALAWADWRIIDRHELASGRQVGRPRVKLTSRDAMLEVVRAARAQEATQ
ncbi:MAG TPA: FAD-dependent oxidoreductase [Ramlibacter sp.]|nr:FAD-dependent oxidoreductase [Ramlibacter sp.]